MYNHKKKLFYQQKLQKKMEKVNVNPLFPMDTQEQINKFLDESDGLFKARCKGFQEFVFNIRSDDEKKFRTSLLNNLFTKNYQLWL